MGERYERVSDVLQVLSHPVRLQIADELRRGEACVCHIQTLVGRSQPYVSQQLSKLREADLVTDRREGLFVYYGLDDPAVERVLEAMLGPLEERGRVAACACPRCEAASRPMSDVVRREVHAMQGEVT